jgi:CYTH domain-containing protein
MSDLSATSEIELEHTYLARHLPEELKGATPKRLIDVYIPEVTNTHPHLRVRKKGDMYEITKKSPLHQGDSSVMVEQTIPLDRVEFEHLSHASTVRIVKDRYNVTIDNYPAEVDVFQEDLRGLVLIDFEFTTVEEKRSFVAPEICFADVTQEDFIAGGLLAGKTYADIEGDLKRFGYRLIES